MNDNDIDALLKELRGHAANGYKTCQYFALTLLVAERDALQKQRDEARENLREACDEIAIRVNTHAMSMNKTAEIIAAERGWDCFAQEGGGA
jgi:adenylate kinase